MHDNGYVATEVYVATPAGQNTTIHFLHKISGFIFLL